MGLISISTKMHKNKSIKNNSGFAHHALLGVLVVGIIVLVGIKVLSAIHAQTPIDTSDSQAYYEPKGNPILDAPAPATTSAHRGNPTCTVEGCYYYAGSFQKNFTASGASALMSVAKPKLDPSEFHTLVEMAVYNSNGNQIELGWTVHHTKNDDGLPHLFVHHAVDGIYACYDGCGFVRNPDSPIHPGSILSAGTTKKFEINFNDTSKQWRIIYNGNLIGYFPASLWRGVFTRIHNVQLYGEVGIQKSAYSPHSEMGNGKLGSDQGSALVKNFTLINSSNSEKLLPATPSAPKAYVIGHWTSTGVHLGGPGFL